MLNHHGEDDEDDHDPLDDVVDDEEEDVVVVTVVMMSKRLRTGWWNLFRVKVDGDDETVKTQDLCEDKDQDHAHEQPRLLCRSPDAGVADDADGVTSGET